MTKGETFFDYGDPLQFEPQFLFNSNLDEEELEANYWYKYSLPGGPLDFSYNALIAYQPLHWTSKSSILAKRLKISEDKIKDSQI